jgi:hypothetical protein
MTKEKEYEKPLPEFRPETKPYWDACKRHEFVLPRSRTTNEFFFYPRAISPGEDMSEDIGHMRFTTWALRKLIRESLRM